jgi:hypothetical protein
MVLEELTISAHKQHEESQQYHDRNALEGTIYFINHIFFRCSIQNIIHRDNISYQNGEQNDQDQ